MHLTGFEGKKLKDSEEILKLKFTTSVPQYIFCAENKKRRPIIPGEGKGGSDYAGHVQRKRALAQWGCRRNVNIRRKLRRMMAKYVANYVIAT